MTELHMATDVAIIGGGPAGLLLSQLLDLAGIRSIVIERQSRRHVIQRVRAGVLEQGTVDLLRRAEVSNRMDRDGQPHTGVNLAFDGKLARIDLEGLTRGKFVTVYGQTAVTEDLYSARAAMGGAILDCADDASLHGLDSDQPYVTFRRNGDAARVDCAFIAACDGFHGVGRQSIPPSVLNTYEKVYPFAWLGILAETKPANEELIYASAEAGFALCSMRASNVSRHYIQAPLDARLEDWPDERFWADLKTRLPEAVSSELETGPSMEKTLAPLRSFVAEPLSYGRLFLAGDAGHIVPPTGAKGLNLAASDVHYLSAALIAYFSKDDEAGLKAYSANALRRVWKAERFSWWMTMLMHRLPDEGPFNARMQRAELDYLTNSTAAMTALAENYVGLPF